LSSTVLVETKEDGESVGYAKGWVLHDDDTFVLQYLYVKKKYRTKKAVVSLISAIFEKVVSECSINKVIWRFTASDGKDEVEVTARQKLLGEIPYCKLLCVAFSWEIKIKTECLELIRGNKIFKPWFWKEKGYVLCCWQDCTDETMSVIRQREISANFDDRYLSPLNQDFGPGIVLDESCSFLISREKGQKPVGWIMCCTVSKEEAAINNFYVYPDERAGMVAHSLASYAFEVISWKYIYISFSVANENRQMKKIVEKYFMPVAETSQTLCSLRIGIVK